MAEHVYIIRADPDGKLIEPDAWRICRDEGDLILYRRPDESAASLRARAGLRAGPAPKIIIHHEVTESEIQ